MGILRALILCALMPIWAFCFFCETTGSCTKLDCSGYASGQKSSASGKIDSEFENLKEAIKELKKQYDKYLDKYEYGVKLYKKLEKLKKYNSLKLDEINFLMEKTNKMLEVKLIEAGEKGLLK